MDGRADAISHLVYASPTKTKGAIVYFCLAVVYNDVWLCLSVCPRVLTVWSSKYCNCGQIIAASKLNLPPWESRFGFTKSMRAMSFFNIYICVPINRTIRWMAKIMSTSAVIVWTLLCIFSICNVVWIWKINVLCVANTLWSSKHSCKPYNIPLHLFVVFSAIL